MVIYGFNSMGNQTADLLGSDGIVNNKGESGYLILLGAVTAIYGFFNLRRLNK